MHVTEQPSTAPADLLHLRPLTTVTAESTTTHQTQSEHHIVQCGRHVWCTPGDCCLPEEVEPHLAACIGQAMVCHPPQLTHQTVGTKLKA